jgi:hypothetical protein
MLTRIDIMDGLVAMLTPRILVLFVLSLAAPAHAAVYKCANEKSVVYQDTACAPGKELRNLDTDPATLSVVPGTPVPTRTAASPPAPKPAKVRATTAKNKGKGGNAAERKFLRAGMSKTEVLYKIGRPDIELSGRRKGGQQWSYMPTADDPATLTTVTFVGGKVDRVERKVVR